MTAAPRIGIDGYPLTLTGGGIRRYTENLLRGLARLPGDERYTVFRGGPNPLPGCDAHPRFDARHPRYPGRDFLDHVAVLGSSETSLYHGTNYFTPMVHGTPTVLTIHDLSVRLFPELHPAKRRLQHALLPWMCGRAEHILALSANTRNDLVALLGVPGEKVSVVRLAVDGAFAPVEDPAVLDAVRARYRLPSAFLLFVGVLEPRKNLPTLIRTVAQLAAQGLRIPLVLAGTGHPRYLARLVAETRAVGLELGRDVLFTGFVSERDLPALYSLCEVFVYPSLYEGFGLPPLEAMACGVPVVVAGNSALDEMYGDCATLAEVRSAAGLCEAIGETLENPALRERLVELGRKRALERSWETVARETLAVYREVLARVA